MRGGVGSPIYLFQIESLKRTKMKTLLIVTDLGLLKAYLVEQAPEYQSPVFHEVRAEDFPNQHSRFSNRDTDQAGRFPSGKTGMAHGERHEEEKQAKHAQARLVAATVSEVAHSEPDCDIYFAAPKTISHELMELLESGVSQRISKNLALDLVKEPVLKLWKRFADAQ